MSKIYLPHIARNVYPTPRLGTFVEGIDANKMSHAVPVSYTHLTLPTILLV